MSIKEYNYLHKVTYYNPSFLGDQQDIQYKKDFLSVFYLDNYEEKKLEKSRSGVFNRYKDNLQIQSIFSNFKENQKSIPFELSNETIFCFLFSFDYFFYFHRCLDELYIYEKISDETLDKLINVIKN